MGGYNSYQLRLLLLLTAIAAVVIVSGCSKKAGKGVDETATAVVDFEASCRLSGFSWITKQPHG